MTTVIDMERMLRQLEDALLAAHRKSEMGSGILVEGYLVNKIKEVRSAIKYERFRTSGVLPCDTEAPCCRQCIDPDQCEASKARRWCSIHKMERRLRNNGETDVMSCALCDAGH